MKSLELITSEKLEAINAEVSTWISFNQQLRSDVSKFSSVLESAKKPELLKHRLLSELMMAQFFTFSSILILIQKRHSPDAFALLRTLYEGQIHIWHLSQCSDQELTRFAALSSIQDWRIAQEALQIDPDAIRRVGFTDEKLSKIKADYESALALFNSRPGKIPRNYRVKTVAELAKEIDSTENDGPWMQWMNLRLYSSGSEYIHRSFYGIREGYAVTQHDEKWVLAPNLFRSIEAAWWSAVVVLNSIKWVARAFMVNFPDELERKIKEAHSLSAKSMSTLAKIPNTHT